MSHDTERFEQRGRVARLQERVRSVLGFDGGESLRLAFETELVQAAREAFVRGKREGVETAKRMPQSSASPPPVPEDARRPPDAPAARTPMVSPRPMLEVNATHPAPRRRP